MNKDCLDCTRHIRGTHNEEAKRLTKDSFGLITERLLLISFNKEKEGFSLFLASIKESLKKQKEKVLLHSLQLPGESIQQQHIIWLDY